MTRRRWIADEVFGNRAVLTGEHAAHLARVLRAQVGQEYDIAADGKVRIGRLISVSDDRVEFELGQELEAAPVAEITLLLAIFKFDRMEWAIEKCTELGAARILPAIARRTDLHLAAAAEKRVERWRRIAREAAEQSRRAVPPEITDPKKIRQIETAAFGDAVRVVLAETEQQDSLRSVLDANWQGGPLVLAIGPEGGWTEDELQRFHDDGWLSASLGPTILRAETAAIAATAVAMSNMQSTA
jgi:16S rRNA (uracil1498-N3)-methyltransferase